MHTVLLTLSLRFSKLNFSQFYDPGLYGPGFFLSQNYLFMCIHSLYNFCIFEQ